MGGILGGNGENYSSQVASGSSRWAMGRRG